MCKINVLHTQICACIPKFAGFEKGIKSIMHFNKIKGAIMASIIVLAVGVVTVKAAPVNYNNKQNVTTISKSKKKQKKKSVTPTETITVTPVDSSNDNGDTTSKVTPIVVTSSKYKVVTLLSQSDIEQITGLELTTKNVYSVYEQLKDEPFWEAAGYSESDAELISDRFEESYNQSISILKKIAKTDNLYLKVVVIHNPKYEKANIGVSKYQSNSEDSKPDTSTPTPTPSPSDDVSKSSLKELEISIEYKKGDVELEYKVKSNGTIKAEYENEFTGEHLKSEEAKEIIESILEGLDINESNETVIIDHILNKLNLDKKYKEFSFEAEFTDGREIEFER